VYTLYWWKLILICISSQLLSNRYAIIVWLNKIFTIIEVTTDVTQLLWVAKQWVIQCNGSNNDLYANNWRNKNHPTIWEKSSNISKANDMGYFPCSRMQSRRLLLEFFPFRFWEFRWNHSNLSRTYQFISLLHVMSTTLALCIYKNGSSYQYHIFPIFQNELLHLLTVDVSALSLYGCFTIVKIVWLHLNLLWNRIIGMAILVCGKSISP
jgi:hypothetical protein